MYRVRTVFTGIQGSPWLSTMYFDSLGAGTAQQAVSAVGTFWGALDNFMGAGVAWATEADVADINSTTGQPEDVTSTTPSTGAGSGGADLLPAATQGLIQWRTGVFANGREVRGRTFIPGLMETASTGGPSGTFASAAPTAAAALIADANSTLIIWSRANSSFAPVTSGTLWTSFAVLRSRRD